MHFLKQLVPKKDNFLDMAEADREFLLLAYSFMQLGLTKQNKRKHRFWVRKILQQRQTYGLYHTLVQEIHLQDREYFYR